MKFVFRTHVQAHAGPAQKESLGFRSASLHASSVAEAAERFLREHLARKRIKTLRQ